MSDDLLLLAALRRIEVLEVHVATMMRSHEIRSKALPDTERAVYRLILEASDLFGASISDIQGHSRLFHVTRARQWVMYEARALGLSYPQIGAAMGRDHTTVKHGCMEEGFRRSKGLPDNENSTKMKAGRNAVDAAPDPNRNRDFTGVRDNG